MASVSSLDGDLRKLRRDKYTPAAANEARAWIEGVLGERLAGGGDLLEGLKDGTALCRLANLALAPPGIRFKTSTMPFVQMENISHFLRACQAPPLNLQQHDCFLTVDLYEAKDPAQVLQCLGAFSRAAHRANPSAFPSAIGPARAGRNGSIVSPQSTGAAAATTVSSSSSSNVPTTPRGRGTTISSESRTPLAAARTGDSGSGRWSPTKHASSNSNGGGPSSPVSAWTKREQEGATSPAWNIAQYGYMGGASQGNLGISFGGRRQITSAGPYVPSLADKEKRRAEKAAEEARLKREMEEEEARRRAEVAAEEERAQLAEQQRWEEETRRLRAEEKRKAEAEKRQWEEEERQWQRTEELRKREEAEAEARLADERQQRIGGGGAGGADPRLHGQFLSEYQAEHGGGGGGGSGGALPSREKETSNASNASTYSNRVRELELELEQARQREQEYERERRGRPDPRPRQMQAQLQPEARDKKARSRSRGARSRSRHRPTAIGVAAKSDAAATAGAPARQDSWSHNEREVLTTPRSQSRPRFADVERPPQSSVAAAAVESSSPFVSPVNSPPRHDDFAPMAAAAVTSQPAQTQAQAQTQAPLPPKSPRPLPNPRAQPVPPVQPVQPATQPPFFQKLRTQRTGERAAEQAPPLKAHRTGGRPLPEPAPEYTSPPQEQPQEPQQPQKPQKPALPIRQQAPQPTEQPALPPRASPFAQPTYAREIGSGVAERDAEDRRRQQTAYRPAKTPAWMSGGGRPRVASPAAAASPPPAAAAAASSPLTSPATTPARPGKSLLEREMELERQRQREWEEAQKETAAAPRPAADQLHGGVGGRWDVSQWSGYTGGDGQNRGSQGIGAGRRQIVGPRPLPGAPR